MQANNAALHHDTATDTVTGLRHKTIYGRPMWNAEFSAVATAHPRSELGRGRLGCWCLEASPPPQHPQPLAACRSVVGVFLCGPGALAKDLQRSCQQHSSLDPRKVKFYFNKENF